MRLTFRKKKAEQSSSTPELGIMESCFNQFCASQAQSLNFRKKFDAQTFALKIDDVGDHYILTANLPGVKKKNIKITCEKEFVTIAAYKKKEESKTGLNFFREEKSVTHIKRRVKVDPIDPNSFQVRFKSGILTVKLNKQ